VISPAPLLLGPAAEGLAGFGCVEAVEPDAHLGAVFQTTHVPRYLRHYRSSGHVWQGRFKAFPTQEDEHLLVVLRYIERNPLRAGLVIRAEDWEWSSLRWLATPERSPVRLEPGTIPRGTDWLEGVSAPMDEVEVERLRECVRRDRPFGADTWTRVTDERLGLESSLRPPGRPRSASSEAAAGGSASASS
jgi:putative transposase